MISLKILIVDDEPHARNLLSILITGFCREMLFAGNGAEAIEICKMTSDIDLIIMDKKMPVTDGYEATRQIRHFNKEVIIIALSASPEESEKYQAIEAGSNGFLYKPVDMEILENMLSLFFSK